MSLAAAAVIATTDYGVDVNVSTDFAPVWGISSGLLTLVNALLRRLRCPRGALWYDPNYGTDIRSYLQARLTNNKVATLKQDISAELTKEEEVQEISSDIALSAAQRMMTITIGVTPVVGETFTMVIAATAVTISLLSINGVPANDVTPSLPAGGQAFVGPTGKDGGPGAAGATGAAGLGGTPQVFLDYDGDEGSTQSGAEDVIYERYVNFTPLPATVTCELGGFGRSTAGTATFKMRVGGTPDTADGTVVATTSTTSNTPAPLNASSATPFPGGFTNPGGWQLVKITGQSSAATQTAGMRKRTATVR